jgi:hypothetical protein
MDFVKFFVLFGLHSKKTLISYPTQWNCSQRDTFLVINVAVRNVHPGSRIQQQQQKRRGKKFFVLPVFLPQIYKIENYIIFEQVKKKSQFTKNYSTFNPKNSH